MPTRWRHTLLHCISRMARHAGLKLLTAVTLSTTQLGMAPASPLGATTVYRCGRAGHDYSQWPCPEGQAVDVRQDQRTTEQTSSAMRLAHGEQELAQGLEQARLRQEIDAAGATAMASPRTLAPAADAPGPPTPPPHRRHGKRSSASRSGVLKETAQAPFTAVVPRKAPSKKAKKNAPRATQAGRP